MVKRKPITNCCNDTTYYAEARSRSTALTDCGQTVYASSTATATSTASYEDALNIAQNTAQEVSVRTAVHDANLVSQTIDIIKKEPINEGYGNILLTNQNKDPLNLQQSSILSILENKDVLVKGNLLPDPDNLLSLGTPENRWSEIFIGPGTVNLYGPSLTKYATISADDNTIAYTETGFATPFINIGPSQLTPYAVGGWQIFPLGIQGTTGYDLIAQEVIPGGTGGTTGPIYSLIKRGLTGPTGPTGILQLKGMVQE